MSGIHIVEAAKRNDLEGLKLLLRSSTSTVDDICEGLAGRWQTSALEHAIMHKNSQMVQIIVDYLKRHVSSPRAKRTPAEQKQDQQYIKNGRESITAAYQKLLSDDCWTDTNAAIFLDLIFGFDQQQPLAERIFSGEQITAFIQKISQKGSQTLCARAGFEHFLKWTGYIEEYDLEVMDTWPTSDNEKSATEGIYSKLKDRFIFLAKKELYYVDKNGQPVPIDIAPEKFEMERVKIMGTTTSKRFNDEQFQHLITVGGGRIPKTTSEAKLETKKETPPSIAQVNQNIQLALINLVIGGQEDYEYFREFRELCYFQLLGSRSLSTFIASSSPETLSKFLASDYVANMEALVGKRQGAAMEMAEIYYNLALRNRTDQNIIAPATDFLERATVYGLKALSCEQQLAPRVLDFLTGIETEMTLSTASVESKDSHTVKWLPFLKSLLTTKSALEYLDPEEERPIPNEDELIRQQLWQEMRVKGIGEPAPEEEKVEQKAPENESEEAENEQEAQELAEEAPKKPTESREVILAREAENEPWKQRQSVIRSELRNIEAAKIFFTAIITTLKISEGQHADESIANLTAQVSQTLIIVLNRLLREGKIKPENIVSHTQQLLETAFQHPDPFKVISPTQALELVNLPKVEEKLNVTTRANFYCYFIDWATKTIASDEKGIPSEILRRDRSALNTSLNKLMEDKATKNHTMQVVLHYKFSGKDQSENILPTITPRQVLEGFKIPAVEAALDPAQKNRLRQFYFRNYHNLPEPSKLSSEVLIRILEETAAEQTSEEVLEFIIGPGKVLLGEPADYPRAILNNQVIKNRLNPVQAVAQLVNFLVAQGEVHVRVENVGKASIGDYIIECISTGNLSVSDAMQLLDMTLLRATSSVVRNLFGSPEKLRDILYICLKRYQELSKDLHPSFHVWFERHANTIGVTRDNLADQCRIAAVIIRLINGEALDEQAIIVLQRTNANVTKMARRSLENIWRDASNKNAIKALIILLQHDARNVTNAQIKQAAELKDRLPIQAINYIIQRYANVCSSEVLADLATSPATAESKAEFNTAITTMMWEHPEIIRHVNWEELQHFPPRAGTTVDNLVFIVRADNPTHLPLKLQYYEKLQSKDDRQLLMAQLAAKAESSAAVCFELAQLYYKQWQERSGSEIFTADLQQALSYAKQAADISPPCLRAFTLLQIIDGSLQAISEQRLEPNAKQRLVFERLDLQNYQAKYQFYKDDLVTRLEEKTLNSDDCFASAVINFNAAVKIYLNVLNELSSPISTEEKETSATKTILEQTRNRALNQLIELMSNEQHAAYPRESYAWPMRNQLSRSLHVKILNHYLDNVSRHECAVIPRRLLANYIAGLTAEDRDDQGQSPLLKSEVKKRKQEAMQQVALRCIATTAALDTDRRVAYLLLQESSVIDQLPVLNVLQAFQQAMQQRQQTGKAVVKLEDWEIREYLRYVLTNIVKGKITVADAINYSGLDAVALLNHFSAICREEKLRVGYVHSSSFNDGMAIFLEQSLTSNLLATDKVVEAVLIAPSAGKDKLISLLPTEKQKNILFLCIKQYLATPEQQTSRPDLHLVLKDTVLSDQFLYLDSEQKAQITQFIINGLKINPPAFNVDSIVSDVLSTVVVPEYGFTKGPFAKLDTFQIFCACLERYPGSFARTHVTLSADTVRMIDQRISQQPPRLIVHYLLVLFQRGKNANGRVVNEVLNFLRNGLLEANATLFALSSELYAQDDRYIPYVQLFKNIVTGYRDFLYEDKPTPEILAKLQLLVTAVLPSEEKETKHSARLSEEDEKLSTAVQPTSLSTESTEVKRAEVKRIPPTVSPVGIIGNHITTSSAIRLIADRYKWVTKVKALNKEWKHAIDATAFSGFEALFQRRLAEQKFDECLDVLQRCRELWPKEKRISQCYQTLGVAIVNDYQSHVAGKVEDDYREELAWRTKNEIQRHRVGIGYEESRNAANLIRWEFHNPLAVRWKNQYLTALREIQDKLNDNNCNPSQLAMTVVDAINSIKGQGILGSTTQKHLLEYLDLIPVDGPRQFLLNLQAEIAKQEDNPWRLPKSDVTLIAGYDTAVIFLQEKLPKSFERASPRELLLLFHEVVTKLQNVSIAANTAQIRELCDQHVRKALSPLAQQPESLVSVSPRNRAR